MSVQGYKLPSEGEGFDLTPMIDVVFLLIVFFMTVASLLTAEKIEMNLAVAEESAIPKEIKNRFTLSITNTGALYLGPNNVTQEELSKRLAKFTQRVDTVKIILRADRLTEHQHINDVLQICAENGITDIIFAAYQTEL
jgi:biopolymer transport protein ExbD